MRVALLSLAAPGWAWGTRGYAIVVLPHHEGCPTRNRESNAQVNARHCGHAVEKVKQSEDNKLFIHYILYHATRYGAMFSNAFYTSRPQPYLVQ
jgi:hypothetical protein